MTFHQNNSTASIVITIITSITYKSRDRPFVASIVCGDEGTYPHTCGITTCLPNVEFTRWCRLGNRASVTCPCGGNYTLTTNTHYCCPPCHQERCPVVGLVVCSQPSSQRVNDDTSSCSICNTVIRLRQTIECASCHSTHFLTCTGLTRVQASALTPWHCSGYLGADALKEAFDDPAVNDTETPLADMTAALATLGLSKVVLRHFPRALQTVSPPTSPESSWQHWNSAFPPLSGNYFTFLHLHRRSCQHRKDTYTHQ